VVERIGQLTEQAYPDAAQEVLYDGTGRYVKGVA